MSPSPIRAENQRDRCDRYSKPDHDRFVAGQDALVDDLTEQHRVDHRDERVDDGREQEHGQPKLVRLGVADDPADGSWLQLLLGHRWVLPHGPHHADVRPPVHALENLPRG